MTVHLYTQRRNQNMSETAASDTANKVQLKPDPSLPQDDEKFTKIEEWIPTNSFRKNPARAIKPEDPAGWSCPSLQLEQSGHSRIVETGEKVSRWQPIMWSCDVVLIQSSITTASVFDWNIGSTPLLASNSLQITVSPKPSSHGAPPYEPHVPSIYSLLPLTV